MILSSIRKRKASANQCLVALKAALNGAFEDELVPSDEAWRKVKTYRGVDVARARYVTVAEAKRLLKACDPDFRNLVRAALETGARYGELTRMKVEDYNPDVGTVAIHVSKTDEPRHVVLTADGDAFFRDMCSGRSGLIFLRADGGKWGPSHQDRRIKVACKRAHIDPLPRHAAHLGESLRHGRHAVDGSSEESRPRRHEDGREALRPSRAELCRRDHSR